jgi:nucleotide-binding universal stress UspA family protein
MSNFNNILVPLDFSAQSEEALRTGVELARRYAAALTVVTVYEPLAWQVPEGTWSMTPEQERRLLAAYDTKLAEAEKEVRDLGISSVQTKLLQGAIAPEIVEHARANGCDLIVMGTHGRRGVSRALLGSVAERVLRSAPCAVLVVRLAAPAEAAVAAAR